MTQQPLPFAAHDVVVYSGPRHTGGAWAVAVLRVEGRRVRVADVDAADEATARERARAVVLREGGTAT